MPEVELPDPKEIREKAHDRFTKRVALVVACYAVALAIASLGGNNAMKEMLLTQQETTNKWGHYQAKSGREALYRVEKLRLELDLAAATGGAEATKKGDELLKKFTDEEQRYEHEKKDIEKEARELEEKQKINLRKDPYFDYAEVMLQIAIVLASISMLATSRLVFLISLVVAIVGVLLTINGFGLFFHVPFLDG